jgi:hypothetical protein
MHEMMSSPSIRHPLSMPDVLGPSSFMSMPLNVIRDCICIHYNQCHAMTVTTIVFLITTSSIIITRTIRYYVISNIISISLFELFVVSLPPSPMSVCVTTIDIECSFDQTLVSA